MILILIALAGLVLTTLQTFAVLRLGRTPSMSSRRRFISILKPVCGLDDELHANLVSFTNLRGIDYEVLISAESEADPAVAVARAVMREHPSAPFRIVIDPGSQHGVVNRKVERLIAAARVARGDVFFISDSNVRVAPDDIARTVAAFDDPRIGCVSNLFTGSGARTFGATIESLHLLGFVVPGAALAAAVNVPCVVGKSMAITRRAHDAIGGFAAFRRILAEDQAIGLAVKEAGFEVALSPLPVRNVIVQRTVRRAVDRQIRWNKIRYSFSRPMYIAELLIHPLPFAILAAVFGSAPLMIAPLLVAVARCLQLSLLNRSTGAGMRPAQILATPLLDVLMLCAWLIPFFSNEVTWRGYRARIGRGTEMVALPAAA